MAALAPGVVEGHSSPLCLKMNPVDIVVPVFGAAAATRRCIESVLGAKCETPFELIVVDDANSDADFARYLRGLSKLGRVTLLEQSAHAGFAAAVNRGLNLHPDRDVVVLH